MVEDNAQIHIGITDCGWKPFVQFSSEDEETVTRVVFDNWTTFLDSIDNLKLKAIQLGTQEVTKRTERPEFSDFFDANPGLKKRLGITDT